MAKIKGVDLTAVERAALEKGRRDGKTYTYRNRCQMILLKAQNRTSKEVAKEVGCCEVVVNSVELRFTCIGSSDTRSKVSRDWLCAKDVADAASCKKRATSPPCAKPCRTTGKR